MDVHHYQAVNAQSKRKFFVSFRIDNVQEMQLRKWCLKTYGPPGIRWEDNIMLGEIVFVNESDLTLFLLRWTNN